MKYQEYGPKQKDMIAFLQANTSYTLKGAFKESSARIHVYKGCSIMELKRIGHKLTVCKVTAVSDIDLSSDLYFIGKTDEEISLVCKTEDTPQNTVARDDGWRGFRIQGVLDFSLIGILAKLSGILAGHKVGIFAVSTYNTDYILVKEENFDKAMTVLAAEGYTIA